MLKTKNNDIYISRGETGSLNFKIWNSDGTPFMLPLSTKQGYKIAHLIDNIAEVNKSGNYVQYTFMVPMLLPDYGTISISGKTTGPNAYINTTVEDTAGNRRTFTGNVVDYGDCKFLVSIYCKNVSISTIGIKAGSIAHTLICTDYNSVPTSILALTVRAGHYDDILFTKYINLHGPMMYGNESDHIAGGWNKFTSYDMVQVSDPMYGLSALIPDYQNGDIKLAYIKYSDGTTDYMQLFAASDGEYYQVPYAFEFSIPLESKDTDIDAREYTYDLIAYQGYVKDSEVFDIEDTRFPLKEILWKKELISPHKFVIGDSHNV